MSSYTLPGIPSDLLNSAVVNDRQLKVDDAKTQEVLNAGLKMSLATGAQLDAFGRLRISKPTALWYDTLEYDKSPLRWYEETTGNATSTHSFADSAAIMEVSGTGDEAIRQVRQPIRYRPGKSRLDILTWGLPELTGDVRFRAGAFNDNDGIFVQVEDGSFSFGIRSSVSGSVVDTLIPQADWSEDKLDGSGPSGFTLDHTKGQIFITDLQWLSMGIVRFGFELNGKLIIAHRTTTANALTQPYMQTANLPIRYQLTSLGGSGKVSAICSASLSEGGVAEEKGYHFTASNGRSPITVAAADTWTPIISIRRAVLFEGHNYHSAVVTPTKFAAYCETSPVQFAIFYKPTLTNANWSAVDSNSGVEKDTSATALSGGAMSDIFYLAAGGQGSGSFSSAGGSETTWLLPVASDPDGSNQDIVTLGARAIGATDATGYGSIDFREVR